MALGTYTQLQAAAVSWSNRSDLSTLIPDFITLAEDRINRALRVRQMEAELSDTIFDNYITLPAGTAAVKALWVDGHEDSPLEARPYEDLLRLGTQGTATAWARQGDNVYFNGDGDVSGVIYERIPALADNLENWLLTAHPTVYLYGTLAELYSYTRNQPQIEYWTAKFEAALADVNGADMRDRFAGPLTVRAR
jgi:hypothetical protein